MKKYVSFLVVVCLLWSQIVCSAENINVYSDGGVHVERDAENIKAGTDVTILVTDEAMTSNEGEGQNTNPVSDVKYVEVKTAENDGKYIFDFYLDKSGTYNCVVAAKDVSDSFKIIYTNREENTALLVKLAEAENEAAVEDLLLADGSSETLMLAEKSIYTEVMSDSSESGGTKSSYKVAKMIYKEEQKAKIMQPFEFIDIAKKAALIVALNGETAIDINDVETYKDILLPDKSELAEYYISAGSRYLTGILKKDKIADIDDLETKLRDAIILTNVKHSDSIDNTKAMLKRFSADLNVTENKITIACVRSMQGMEFGSLKDIKNYIDKYDNSTSGGSSGTTGGSSGGTGGGGTGKGSISGATYSNTYKNNEGSTDVKAPFKDLDNVSWAIPAVTALYAKGIVTGKNAEEFCQNDYITRAEFDKLLIKIFELNVQGNGMDFEDVKDNDWYYNYVRSAYYADIVNGISDTFFGAEQNITREDIATMSCRAADVSGVTISETINESVFADEDTVAEYARDAVRLMQRGGIINGHENGNFNPKANATRAEAAKIIYNLFLMI